MTKHYINKIFSEINVHLVDKIIEKKYIRFVDLSNILFI
jgi:hypothetical protein|nr:MAG TPA: hypothetical protein [Caudoviricetes sp.]